MSSKFLKGIEVGEVHAGIVRTVTDFGAFVDLTKNGEVKRIFARICFCASDETSTASGLPM
jgi:polyribonucleotide nucleotidyltransferase